MQIMLIVKSQYKRVQVSIIHDNLNKQYLFLFRQIECIKSKFNFIIILSFQK